MKAQRTTANTFARAHVFVFSRGRPKTLLRVACNSTGVWILADKNSFSVRDKDAFVHYLAEEGFIPERYLGFSTENPTSQAALHWLIEEPSSDISPKLVIMVLLGCGFFLWIIQIGALLVTRR